LRSRARRYGSHIRRLATAGLLDENDAVDLMQPAALGDGSPRPTTSPRASMTTHERVVLHVDRRSAVATPSGRQFADAAEVPMQPVAKAVLIVEDHPLVAQAMVGELSARDSSLDLQICGTAERAMALLTGEGKPWFRIFLDLDVPGAFGLSLARQIHGIDLHARCCVLTALNKSELITEVYRLGFLGYIIKASPYGDFEHALGAVMVGERSFPLQRVGGQASIRISRRQEQLLDGVSRGMSSKDLARELSLTEGTVSNCITSAMKALNVSTRTHAVAKALELGLLSLRAGDDNASDQRDKVRRLA
jgi:two-component system, NarL family, response regulator DesR